MTTTAPTAVPVELELPRRRFRFSPVPAIPALIIILTVLVAIFANFLAPENPNEGELIDSLTPPIFVEGGTTEHWLGTDLQGRDILSRLIFGARISITVSLAVLTLATIVGVSLGIAAGFFGGIWDLGIMRFVDVVLSFPPLLIAIVFAVIFGPSFQNVILIITLFYWPLTARQVRAEVLALKVQEYVALARVAGASNFRIMFRHILPSVIPTVLVITTLQVGAVIIFEASLSFLGVGVPPPNPSWGIMVADGRGQLSSAWWLSLFPGLMIFVIVLAMNSVGDWLRDRLDPRLRSL